MHIDELREICLNLPGTSETFPFGPETPVFKTTANNKVFAISSMPGAPSPSVTLKADPEDAKALCAQHDGITPGYHMNKKHWVSVALDSGVPDDLVAEMVTESYTLVKPKVPRARRENA